jgi:hypothetical protein
MIFGELPIPCTDLIFNGICTGLRRCPEPSAGLARSQIVIVPLCLQKMTVYNRMAFFRISGRKPHLFFTQGTINAN